MLIASSAMARIATTPPTRSIRCAPYCRTPTPHGREQCVPLTSLALLDLRASLDVQRPEPGQQPYRDRNDQHENTEEDPTPAESLGDDTGHQRTRDPWDQPRT